MNQPSHKQEGHDADSNGCWQSTLHPRKRELGILPHVSFLIMCIPLPLFEVETRPFIGNLLPHPALPTYKDDTCLFTDVLLC